MTKKILAVALAASLLISCSGVEAAIKLYNSEQKAEYALKDLEATKSSLVDAEANIAALKLELRKANETIIELQNAPQFVVEAPRHYDIDLRAELQTFTYTTCCKYGIPEYYELVLAIMQHESQFVEDAVGPTDDYGLMQINKFNHDWLAEDLGLHDMLDPYQNIKAGVHMLSTYLDKYSDVAAALMCYNMGEPTAEYYWEQGIRSTSYSDSILAIYREYIDIKIE